MNWSLFIKPFTKFSRSLILILLFGGVGGGLSLFACGVSYPSDYFQVFFLESDLFEDPEYRSFYYPYYFNYKESGAYSYVDGPGMVENNFENANISDWATFFSGTIPEADLSNAIYNFDRMAFEQLYTALQNGKDPVLKDSAKENQLLMHFASGKDREALRYLWYAKRCEEASVYDRWGDIQSRDKDQMAAKIQEGRGLWAETNSAFLKDRYAFQIVRLAHYSGKYEEAASAYDELFEGPEAPQVGSQLIRDRSLLLKAGALKWLKQFGKSEYLFSKVFQNSPPLRTSAEHDFSFFGSQYFRDALSYAQDDAERANLWAMRGFHLEYPNVEILRNLADLDTDGKLLEVLLIRQLNLLEAEIMSPRLTQNSELDQKKINDHVYRYPQAEDVKARFDPGQIQGYAEPGKGFWKSIGNFFGGIWDWITGLFSVADPQNSFYEPEAYREEEVQEEDLNQDRLLQEFRDFTSTQARNGKVEHPGLWYLAAGYIEFMRGQYGTAEGYFKNAQNESEANSPLTSQIKLLRVLNQIQDQGKMPVGKDEDCLAAVQWLGSMQETHQNDRILRRTLTLIGQAYLVEGDLPKAIFAFGRAGDDLSFNILCDVYAQVEDLETLRDQIEAGPTSPWEAYLMDDFPLGREQLQDLIGTRYIRQGNFESAYREFKGLPESYWTARTEDPDWQEYSYAPETTTEPPQWAYFQEYKEFSVSFFAETVDEDTEEGAPELVTKLTFLEKVVDLEKQANNNPDEAYACYLKVAKGFESSPYWGYSGVLWHGDLTWSWQFYYAANQYPFNLPEISTNLYIREHEFLIEYGSYELAQVYYQKAMDATTDDELGAEACFGALSCEGQFHSSLHRYHDWPTDAIWFEQFSDRYSGTATYDFTLRSCPNMQAYLNRAVN